MKDRCLHLGKDLDGEGFRDWRSDIRSSSQINFIQKLNTITNPSKQHMCTCTYDMHRCNTQLDPLNHSWCSRWSQLCVRPCPAVPRGTGAAAALQRKRRNLGRGGDSARGRGWLCLHSSKEEGWFQVDSGALDGEIWVWPLFFVGLFFPLLSERSKKSRDLMRSTFFLMCWDIKQRIDADVLWSKLLSISDSRQWPYPRWGWVIPNRYQW